MISMYHNAFSFVVNASECGDRMRSSSTSSLFLVLLKSGYPLLHSTQQSGFSQELKDSSQNLSNQNRSRSFMMSYTILLQVGCKFLENKFT